MVVKKLKPWTRGRQTLSIEQVFASSQGQANLIRYCESIEADELPPDDLLVMLAICFRQIIDGVDPKKALFLSQSREGRPGLTLKDKIYQAGVVLEVKERRKNGETLENARAAVAAAHGRSEDTLRAWCKQRRKDAEKLRAFNSNLEKNFPSRGKKLGR